MDRSMDVISVHYSGAFNNKKRWPFKITLKGEKGEIFQAKIEISSAQQRHNRFEIEGALSFWSIDKAILKVRNGIEDIESLKLKKVNGNFKGFYNCQIGLGCIVVRASDLEI